MTLVNIKSIEQHEVDLKVFIWGKDLASSLQLQISTDRYNYDLLRTLHFFKWVLGVEVIFYLLNWLRNFFNQCNQ